MSMAAMQRKVTTAGPIVASALAWLRPITVALPLPAGYKPSIRATDSAAAPAAPASP